MSDLAYLSIAEGSALLRDKKLSPVEWTQALIARVERHDGRFNAFLRFTPEIALADARRAEAEISAGNSIIRRRSSAPGGTRSNWAPSLLSRTSASCPPSPPTSI